MFNHKLKAQLQACQARLDEEQGFAQGIKGGAATIIFSPDGEILEVSDPFLSLMGYGAGELLVVSTSPRALVTALPFSSVTGIPTSFEI